MKSIFSVVMIFSAFSSAYAVDSRKCSRMMNEGLFKKYTYGGIGEAHLNVCTQNSKKQGSSTVTTDASTEGTTRMTDPKYTSNVWTSQTQSTSSWGECSGFAMTEQLKKDREIYIAQNETEVLIDMARGDGEHLKVITFYSACLPEAYQELSSELKNSLSGSPELMDSKSICLQIDKIISENQSLMTKCRSI